jgi:5-carboxymethyl-2-hydroxymuconate isomerase
MPHFIIDCSENILTQRSPEEIMQAVYETADTSGLFVPDDIKVRIHPYKYYKLGLSKKNFIHVFGYIMEGRSVEQKAALSRAIIEKLNKLFPDIAILSMNIYDFEKATYCNKALVDAENTSGDRHFGLNKNN